MCIDSTVFLIDDDAAVRDALSISLSMAGLKIEVYPSGKVFLDAYIEDRPGCLLINLGQPEMDGLTVQQELIRRNFLTPIIFMTEIGTIRDSLPAMRSGTFCLLEKPFPRPLLLESIREAMEQDCENRTARKTQAKIDDYSADPQPSYKRLSPREREIMALITLGKSGKSIAGMLELALRTSARMPEAYLAELVEI